MTGQILHRIANGYRPPDLILIREFFLAREGRKAKKQLKAHCRLRMGCCRQIAQGNSNVL